MNKKVMTRFLGVILLGLVSVIIPVSPAGATKNTTAPALTCAGAGKFCGGIAGIQCCPGLTCHIRDPFPDAGGKCVF